MDKIKLLAIAGILFLMAAGIFDYTEKGSWKLLALSILYAISNFIVFIIK